MFTLKAINDKVILKQIESTETRHNNIIIPDLGKEIPQIGEVISVGEGFYTINGVLIQNKLKEGDIVLFPKFGAQQLTVGNDDYIICKEMDILAIVSK